MILQFYHCRATATLTRRHLLVVCLCGFVETHRRSPVPPSFSDADATVCDSLENTIGKLNRKLNLLITEN